MGVNDCSDQRLTERLETSSALTDYAFELRTLVFSIAGLSRILKEDLGCRLPQDLRTELAGLVRAGDHVVDRLASTKNRLL